MKYAYKTVDEWLLDCTQRFLDRSDLGPVMAQIFAEACAEYQEQINGTRIEDWDDPIDTADEDMSCWSD